MNDNIWIRTQDRKKLINLSNGICFLVKECLICDKQGKRSEYYVKKDEIVLGSYATLEKAIKELDSIQQGICIYNLVIKIHLDD